MSVLCDRVRSSGKSAHSGFKTHPLVPELHPLTVEPASGPQRSYLANMAAAKADREKRKRSRVTPEQLVHLERFFAVDRGPTAVRRKEISDLLGMQERQTQIWFQNRSVPTSVCDPAPYQPADGPRLNYKMVKRVEIAVQ